MLDGWGGHPAVAQALAEASDALGEDLGRLIQEGPKEALGLTTNTQPVMLVAGVAAYRAWLAEGGPQPAVVAGHSLGEYSALVAAGVLTLADAAPLVRFRAQAMQEAVPVGTGAMAAVLGMDAQKVVEGCAEAQRSFGANSLEVVEAANFNDPAQTVIAGSKAAVDKACEMLKANGAKRALLLPVSAPFHSSLMKPAADRLREKLAQVTFAAPRIPGGQQHRGQGRDRRRHASAPRCTSRPSGRCAGSTASAPSRPAASAWCSSAAPARCCQGLCKRIDPPTVRRRRVRPGVAGRGEGAAGMSADH
jgi:[acyl-carrier-protein] S-malonyltransferase